MISFDDFIKENIKEHNSYWHQNPDHSYRIIIFGGQDLEKQIHYLIQ